MSRQSDAIVTWCWNDFCTLGKTHLLRHETTSEGLIGIYQYTSYPRFQLSINERLSKSFNSSNEAKKREKKNLLTISSGNSIWLIIFFPARVY